MFSDLFYKMGYKLKVDNNNSLNSSDSCLTFVKPGHETEFFEIRGTESQYTVSAPIKSSTFQYKTTFKNYEDALVFLESKFKDYVYD